MNLYFYSNGNEWIKLYHLYNEILMVFSVRGERSSALEFHTEKPHWFKQTWLILGFVHLFSFFVLFSFISSDCFFLNWLCIFKFCFSVTSYLMMLLYKIQTSWNQQIMQGTLFPLPLYLKTTAVNVGALGSHSFRMKVEKQSLLLEKPKYIKMNISIFEKHWFTSFPNILDQVKTQLIFMPTQKINQIMFVWILEH